MNDGVIPHGALSLRAESAALGGGVAGQLARMKGGGGQWEEGFPEEKQFELGPGRHRT